MSKYSITTIEQLCERIINIGDGDLSTVIPEIDPKVFERRIHIEGEGYCACIPGFLLQGLSDFQTSSMRTYNFLINGKEDLRGLQKDNLWTTIRIQDGSLELIFRGIGLGIGLGKTILDVLPPSVRAGTIIFVSLCFAGYGCYSAYSNKIVETSKIEAQKEIELAKIQMEVEVARDKAKFELERDRQRDQLIKQALDVIKEQAVRHDKAYDVCKVAEKNAQEGIESVVRSARGATKISTGNTIFNAEMIKKIQSPEVPSPKPDIKFGKYKIIQINTESADSWKVLFLDVVTKEKISANIEPQNLFMSLVDAKELFDFQKDEKILEIKFCVVRKSYSTNYSVEQLKVL